MIAKYVKRQNGRWRAHFGGFTLISYSCSTFQCCGFLLSLLMLQGLGQRQYIATQAHPGLAGYPTFKRLHGKTRPRLGGLPGLVDRATRLGGLPHLSCKREAEKIKVYMDRRVILPRRVTPPPCKDNVNVKEYVTPKYNSAISQVFWIILSCSLIHVQYGRIAIL